MAVKIRLKRIGAKKKPFYRIVVADARYPRDGRFIEQIGIYDPMSNPAKVSIDGAKVMQWMKNGAQPTDTVRALIKSSGAIEKAKEDELKRRLEAEAQVVSYVQDEPLESAAAAYGIVAEDNRGISGSYSVPEGLEAQSEPDASNFQSAFEVAEANNDTNASEDINAGEATGFSSEPEARVFGEVGGDSSDEPAMETAPDYIDNV